MWVSNNARESRSEISQPTKVKDGFRERSWMLHGTQSLGKRLIAIIAAVTMAMTLSFALPVGADPADETETSAPSTTDAPATADEAKSAWLAAATQAEKANEDLLVAEEDQAAAEAAVNQAMVELAQATLLADSAHVAAVTAAAQYADLKEQLSHFASASFRGVRLSQLSALLTAHSSTDYLDEVASIDQVAGHKKQLMNQALEAKAAAELAAESAEKAQSASANADQAAQAALDAAEEATEEVAARKKAREEDVRKYRELFTQLSAEEREAAIEAQQAAWEAETARLAALAAEADDNGRSSSPGDSDQPALRATAEATNPRAQRAVDAALSKVGARYIYGANGPNAFDCSGLTSWAWRQAGVTIPRTSRGQSGLTSVPLDQLQPGDLVTFYSPVHHVAMYIGNGQIVHASTESKPVFVTSLYKGGPYPTGHRPHY